MICCAAPKLLGLRFPSALACIFFLGLCLTCLTRRADVDLDGNACLDSTGPTATGRGVNCFPCSGPLGCCEVRSVPQASYESTAVGHDPGLDYSRPSVDGSLAYVHNESSQPLAARAAGDNTNHGADQDPPRAHERPPESLSKEELNALFTSWSTPDGAGWNSYEIALVSANVDQREGRVYDVHADPKPKSARREGGILQIRPDKHNRHAVHRRHLVYVRGVTRPALAYYFYSELMHRHWTWQVGDWWRDETVATLRQTKKGHWEISLKDGNGKVTYSWQGLTTDDDFRIVRVRDGIVQVAIQKQPTSVSLDNWRLAMRTIGMGHHNEMERIKRFSVFSIAAIVADIVGDVPKGSAPARWLREAVLPRVSGA